MRKYETVVALSPELSEAELQKFTQDFKKIFEAKGAQELRVDDWGKRQMAFNVKKKSHAHYLCFFYSSNVATVVTDVNTQLRLLEHVLLFQTHRLDQPIRAAKPGSTTVRDDAMY